MSTHRYVVAFSDTRRWQTTVSAGSGDEAIDIAERLWDAGGVDGEHPFDLIDDCLFDQPEWRIEDEAPPEQTWTVLFYRNSAHRTTVRATTEREAIGIAQSMVHETDIALFERCWFEDGNWEAEPSRDGGAS